MVPDYIIAKYACVRLCACACLREEEGGREGMEEREESGMV